jgi:hypothetical protein
MSQSSHKLERRIRIDRADMMVPSAREGWHATAEALHEHS